MRSLSAQDWLIIMIVGVVILWTVIVKYIGPVIATWITTVYMFVTILMALVSPLPSSEESENEKD